VTVAVAEVEDLVVLVNVIVADVRVRVVELSVIDVVNVVAVVSVVVLGGKLIAWASLQSPVVTPLAACKLADADESFKKHQLWVWNCIHA
jgi:hypothetical protein